MLFNKVFLATLKFSVYEFIFSINLCSSSARFVSKNQNGPYSKENSCMIFVRKAISNRWIALNIKSLNSISKL